MIWLCIKLSCSNGKKIPSHGCGWMDERGLCFVQNNVKVLCAMFMMNWPILG